LPSRKTTIAGLKPVVTIASGDFRTVYSFTMARISVIVPVFNASAWIESCIQGLLSQEYDPADFEIVMVDNNSSDDSVDKIRHYDRIRVLHEREQGSYSARNLGVRQSSGDLLAFTDADCVPAPGWLKSIDAAMRNPQTQVVLGARGFASPSRALRLIAAYEDARVQYILTNRRKRSYFAFTNNMAVRRIAFDRYGPFRTVARGGDTLFLQQLADGEGPEAAEWSPEMRISHLELCGASDYLRKSFLYARARQFTKPTGQCELLSSLECLQIFQRVSSGRSPWDRITLALLLSTGRLTWTVGSLL
jgi:glycosyltransferase involved in cell wall biosynthesis